MESGCPGNSSVGATAAREIEQEMTFEPDVDMDGKPAVGTSELGNQQEAGRLLVGLVVEFGGRSYVFVGE